MDENKKNEIRLRHNVDMAIITAWYLVLGVGQSFWPIPTNLWFALWLTPFGLLIYRTVQLYIPYAAAKLMVFFGERAIWAVKNDRPFQAEFCMTCCEFLHYHLEAWARRHGYVE